MCVCVPFFSFFFFFFFVLYLRYMNERGGRGGGGERKKLYCNGWIHVNELNKTKTKQKQKKTCSSLLKDSAAHDAASSSVT